jgi:D-alanyl-D-alanine carboxypeptidase
MPNPVLVGARLRRAPFLMLAALASALLASPAAATRPNVAADGGDPEDTVVLPDDPVEADLGGALGSLDARIDAERAEASAAAKSLADARGRLEAAAALKPRPIGRLTGRYPAVQCPGGGSITIDGSLAHNVNAMLRTAWGDGVNLCGGGYRDRKQQIRLRIQNCGSSSYAIYRMPSGNCSPPTAIPGTSMHERGLAIDFRCAGRGIPSRSGPCFGWMAGHAAAFGFFNLPSEPWHWSTTGQ